MNRPGISVALGLAFAAAISTSLPLSASTAHADTLYANPNDPGRITALSKGVWEIDLNGLGVLTRDQEGDASVTRLSTDFSAGLQYFIKHNLSVGASASVNYDDAGGGVKATSFGGSANAVLHLRLGLGAFFRPGLGLGLLFGSREAPAGTGMVSEASQFGVITRLQLPIAYFASRRLLLQAGPQLNVTLGSYTPTGGSAQSFTRIAGGFAVGVGYVF